VKFIEFKLTEMEVIINPISYKDKIIQIQHKIQIEKERNQFLSSPNSYKKAESLVEDLKKQFNELIDSFRNNNQDNIFKSMSFNKFVSYDIEDKSSGLISLNNSTLCITIQLLRSRYAVSQSYMMQVEKAFNFDKNKKVQLKKYRMNVDSQNFDFSGWSEEKEINQNHSNYQEVYLRQIYNYSIYYELDKVIYSNEKLINEAMIDLIESIEKNDSIFK